MSVLFDSLRRGRQAARPHGATRRKAQADAVLATLGYPPERRRHSARQAIGRAAAGAVVLIAGWVAWSWYSASTTRPVPSGPQPAQARSGSTQGKPLPPPGKAESPTSPSSASPATVPPPTPAAPVTSGRGPLPQTKNAPPATQELLVAPPQRPLEAPRSTPPPATTTAPPAPRRSSGGAPVPPSPRASAPPPTASTPTPSATPAPPRIPAGKSALPTSTPSAGGVDDFQLALYYQRAGDFDNALIHYRALLQRSPSGRATTSACCIK